MILGQQCWVFCLFVRWFEDIRALSVFLTTRFPWPDPTKACMCLAPSGPCWALTSEGAEGRWHLTEGAFGVRQYGMHCHQFGVLHWITKQVMTMTRVSGRYVWDPHVLPSCKRRLYRHWLYFCPSWLTSAPDTSKPYVVSLSAVFGRGVFLGVNSLRGNQPGKKAMRAGAGIAVRCLRVALLQPLLLLWGGKDWEK